MSKFLILIVWTVLCVRMTLLAAGQAAVGPAPPRGAETLAKHEQNLRALLSTSNADKVWTQGDPAKLNQLLKDLQDAQSQIEGIVGPVAPKPKPVPLTPTPKPKPKKEEIEDATAALRRTLAEASKKQPTLRLPATNDGQLDRITAVFSAVQ